MQLISSLRSYYQAKDAAFRGEERKSRGRARGRKGGRGQAAAGDAVRGVNAVRGRRDSCT